MNNNLNYEGSEPVAEGGQFLYVPGGDSDLHGVHAAPFPHLGTACHYPRSTFHPHEADELADEGQFGALPHVILVEMVQVAIFLKDQICISSALTLQLPPFPRADHLLAVQLVGQQQQFPLPCPHFVHQSSFKM